MPTDGFIISQDGKTLTKCEFAKLGTVISVPAGITKIANGVFAEAPVTKVILPDSVTEIGQNLFSSSETLEDVKLPSNLNSLKPFTFAGCSSLRKITMPDNITSFPEGLFWGCISLPEIPFRNGMEALEPDVFRDCESITSIQIPPSVKVIKTGALSGCTNLSTIVFPAGLENIQDRSLAGLKSLQYMRFSGDCDNFFVDENGGCLYQLTENGAVLIKCPVNVESVYLVENTCDVHIDAFECCNSLAEVYASENAPEALVNKLMELIPHLDINSYSDEPSEEEAFSEKIKDLGEDLDKVQVNEDEFSAIGEFTQDDADDEEETTEDNSITESSDEEEISINQNELESILNQHNVVEPAAAAEPALETNTDTDSESAAASDEDARIQEILNSQCCRNDSLDEGFRPISMDELENLMNGPVVDPMEQLKANEAAAETTSEPEASDEDARIQEILNSQCCRNDSLDEGFRPISMDELENLMNGPVVDPMEQLKANEQAASISEPEITEPVIEATEEPVSEPAADEEPAVAEEEKPKRRRASKKTETTDSTEEKPKRKRARKSAASEDEQSEDKPKRRRASKKTKKTEDIESPVIEEPVSEPAIQETEEPVVEEQAQDIEIPAIDESAFATTEEDPVIEPTAQETEEQVVQDIPEPAVSEEQPEVSEEPAAAPEEPRFIRAMKNLASHQMVVKDEGNKIDNVFGGLKELLVIADGVAPSTNDFSSHLVKFSKAVAKKYGFTKIYFFEDLPLDNPEFIYGLESFGNFRNVLYACNKPSAENISEDQKGLIDAAGISLPASSRIQSVKEKLSDADLQYPVKILVQDNYIEGLLYCAEKYRKEHDIK